MRPSYDEPSFVDLALALAGVAGSAKVTTAAAEVLSKSIGGSRHIVFVLIDGLGDELLARAPEHGFLRRHRDQALRAVFPSTTAAALTSLGTATWPAEHASCGWWMYLASSGLSITTLPFVERFGEEPLERLGMTAPDVFPVASVWCELESDVLMLMKKGLQDSAFARYVSGGVRREGYKNMDDALSRVTEHVMEAHGPTLTYVYLTHLDSYGHEKGLQEVESLLEELDAGLGSLCSKLGDRARLVISADHGMIDLPRDRVVVIEENDVLFDTLVAPPTGEPCVPIFHVREGREESFLERFHELCGNLFALITPDEAERLSLYGPGKLSKKARSRLGSFIGIPERPAAIYSRSKGRTPFIHRAVHGGLTPAEMRVPLILAGGDSE